MSEPVLIRRGHSCAQDAKTAVQEFHLAVAQPDMALVIFFCTSAYDLAALAEELNRLLPDVPVIGCTTAGEIGPLGYTSHSLAGASLSRTDFSIVTGCLGKLQDFEIAAGEQFAHDLLHSLSLQSPGISAQNSFAFLLIDGLSVREEVVVRTFQHALGFLPLVGGSAGDDLHFERTQVFHDGAFHDDSAVLLLASTSLPFKTFKTQHFVCDNERMVVTEADSGHRIVKEINGLPAAEEYARVVGCEVSELSPAHFAATPLVVVIDGTEYVRSIQKVNRDGSLTFFCAIDEGLVLRLVRGMDLVTNLENTFAQVHVRIGPPQLVLACDCILRQLEISQEGLTESVAELFTANHVVGFNTYGEQFGGVHVNQTLTAIAFGSPAEPAP